MIRVELEREPVSLLTKGVLVFLIKRNGIMVQKAFGSS